MSETTVLVVECYPGVFEAEVLQALTLLLKPELVVRAWEAFKTAAEIDAACAPMSLIVDTRLYNGRRVRTCL